MVDTWWWKRRLNYFWWVEGTKLTFVNLVLVKTTFLHNFAVDELPTTSFNSRLRCTSRATTHADYMTKQTTRTRLRSLCRIESPPLHKQWICVSPKNICSWKFILLHSATWYFFPSGMHALTLVLFRSFVESLYYKSLSSEFSLPSRLHSQRLSLLMQWRINWRRLQPWWFILITILFNCIVICLSYLVNFA